MFGGEEWLHYHVLIEYRAKPADDPYEEWHLSSMEYEDTFGRRVAQRGRSDPCGRMLEDTFFQNACASSDRSTTTG